MKIQRTLWRVTRLPIPLCEIRGVEPGTPATDDHRPVFQQMIADATQPPAPFDAILVHRRSRFFRDLFHFLHYKRVLAKVGARQFLGFTRLISFKPSCASSACLRATPQR
jgi:Resolvase, N terminal domain